MRRIQLAIVSIILYLFSLSAYASAAVSTGVAVIGSEKEFITTYEKVSHDFIPLIALVLSSATTLASTTHMGYILLVVLKVILVVGTFGIVKYHGAYILEVVTNAMEYYAKIFF